MSLKAEKVEPEYQEGDPVPLKEDPIYPEEPLSVKEEPLFLEEPLKEEPLSEEQPNYDPSALADLYTDHEINNDVVIGPITLQPQDVAFATPVLEKSCERLAPTNNVTRKTHRCYICQRTFIDDSLLINHVCIPQDVLDAKTIPQTVSESDKPNFIHNYSAGKPFYCSICQKQYKSKTSLKYHTFTHSKEVVTCKICNLKFYSQNDLEAHHKYHVGFDNNYNIDEDTVVVVRIGEGRYVSATFTSINDTAAGSSDVASLPKCSPPRQILIQDSSKLNSTAINEHFTKKYNQIEDQRLHTGSSNDFNEKSLLHRNQGIQGNQPSSNGVVVNLNGPLLKYLYCEVCKKEIKVKDNLNAHMKSHERKKKNFQQRSNQDIQDGPASATANPNDIAVNSNKQKFRHKKGKYLYCEVCKKEIKVKDNLNAHMKSHERKKKNFQQRSNQDIQDGPASATANPNDIAVNSNKHKLSHKKGKYLYCEVCKKEIKVKDNLNAHMKSHERKKKKFSQRSNQDIQDGPASATANPNDIAVNSNKHKLSHKKGKYLYCEVCKKEIKVKDNLNAHMKSHERKKKKFSQRSNQDIQDDPANATANPNDIAVNSNKHKLRHKKEKYLNCKAYKKKLKVKDNSNAHMAEQLIHKSIHMGEDKFICVICQKAFNCKNKLVTHIKYHLRPKLIKKLFTCDICEKKFLTNSHLRAHQLMHAPEKNYSCGICEKRFHIKGVLRKHIRYVHEGKRPFKCETCQKAFAHRANLNVHVVLHGEKKQICKICGKKFHQKFGLRSHMATHAVRDPFTCDMCKRHFNRKTALISHIKVMHTECDSKKPLFILYSRHTIKT